MKLMPTSLALKDCFHCQHVKRPPLDDAGQTLPSDKIIFETFTHKMGSVLLCQRVSSYEHQSTVVSVGEC